MGADVPRRTARRLPVIAGVVLVGAFAVVALVACAPGDSGPSGLHSGDAALESVGASVAQASVAPSTPTGLDPEAIPMPEPADFAWASADWIPPGPGQQAPPGYTLQGGTLADEGPMLNLPVQLVIGAGPQDAGRLPAISEPQAGVVVYVADDGAVSTVGRASLVEGGEGSVVAELEQIVWTVAIEHDASHAYLALVDRATRTDAGLARLALDGTADLELLIGPQQASRTDVGDGIRLAAIVGYRAWLFVSFDDRHLVRRVCPDPAQPCAVDVVNLESGDVTSLPPEEGHGEVLGIADGLLVRSRCNQTGCRLAVLDIASGEERTFGEMSGSAVTVAWEGRTLIVLNETLPAQGGEPLSVLTAVDPVNGGSTQILQAPGFVDLMADPTLSALKLVEPPGWIAAKFYGPEEQLIAIRATDGEVVELPPVPIVFAGVPQNPAP